MLASTAAYVALGGLLGDIPVGMYPDVVRPFSRWMRSGKNYPMDLVAAMVRDMEPVGCCGCLKSGT